MLSGKDVTTFVLAAGMLPAPLAAVASGGRHAPPETVQKSGAMPPGDNRPPLVAKPSDAASPATPAPASR